MSKETGQAIRDVLDNLADKKKAMPYLELDSMMLSQVVEVAQLVSQNDINSTHIQNWVRRKYIPNPVKKKYSREQVANILLINDLRNIMSLENISRLLSFVNRNPLDTGDDRINPTELYKYYSRVFDSSNADWRKSLEGLEEEVNSVLADEDLAPEDREQVATTLLMLNLLARANLYKQIAEGWLQGLNEAD